MMVRKFHKAVVFFCVLVLLAVVPLHAGQNHWKDLQSLAFPENYPPKESADRLYDEVLFQRACQVVIWSLPATALWAMKKGSEAEFGEDSNVFPIWKDRLSAETIVSTPNSDVIYGMGYLDLKKDGPTVIEVPPKLQGILDDFWHRPLTDVRFVGPDKGEGGKYLILPPDFKGEGPEGYFTFKSSTYNVFVFWRAFRDEDGGTKEGVALMERTKIYPLSKKDNPPEMVFPNGTGRAANMLYPQDYSYFEGLADFVSNEYVGPEDWSMRGMMASFGIIKGKPFEPDAHMKEILADVGMKMTDRLTFISAQNFPRGRLIRIICAPFRAKAGLPCCASIVRPKLSLTSLGGRVILRRSNNKETPE